jgi:hypothetical protein
LIVSVGAKLIGVQPQRILEVVMPAPAPVTWRLLVASRRVCMRQLSNYELVAVRIDGLRET